MEVKMRFRCFGNHVGQEEYARYHDEEWGIPVYDDHRLFELLILEGAQAGLAWETILKKREGYRNLFCQFDPQQVALLSDSALEDILSNPAIIRHRGKIWSVRNNAKVFLHIQERCGSFASFLWDFVSGCPIVHHWNTWDEVPTSTPLSTQISMKLRQMGMQYVGPTIVYAYLQAVGVVQDHLTSCWRYGLLALNQNKPLSS